jgi:hypothetical protein
MSLELSPLFVTQIVRLPEVEIPTPGEAWKGKVSHVEKQSGFSGCGQ